MPLHNDAGSVVVDMPAEEYFNLPYASSSILKILVDRSPMHTKVQHPETPALSFGTLFHAMLLEPERIENIAVKPRNANSASNEGKRTLLAWLEKTTGETSNAGANERAEGKILSAKISELSRSPVMNRKLVCSQVNFDRAATMVDVVFSRSLGRAIFGAGSAEVVMLTHLDGVACKARMDWIPDGLHMICDPKTTDDAGKEGFRKACRRWNYPLQAAFYPRVHQAIHGGSRPTFVHVAIEKTPPHDIGFYELEAADIEKANREIDYALEWWAECENRDHWPGTGWDRVQREYIIQPLSLYQQ
jgi:hypothetical protein